MIASASSARCLAKFDQFLTGACIDRKTVAA